MNSAKRKRLESKGWKTGTASEFLDLSPGEEDDSGTIGQALEVKSVACGENESWRSIGLT